MPSGSLKVKLRPLRLAFLVQPTDGSALRQAVQASSFLWGGAFNPIVPFYSRLPKKWGKDVSNSQDASAVIEGYLQAFDPDIIVKVGDLENRDLKFENRQVIKCSEIFDRFEEYGAPRFGIGMHEILRHFSSEELTFVRHRPLKMQIPLIGKKHSLFLESVFGSFPERLKKFSKQWWANLPGAEIEPCDVSNYAAFLASDNLFIRRLGSVDIQTRSSSFRRSDCVFLMDAEENLDIIDYWNLRALGWTVIPVCKQAANERSVIKLVTEFVEENSFAFRGNPNLFNDTMLLKSRNVSPIEVEKFGSSLPLKPSKHPHEGKILYQFAYPRIWDDWAREKDGAEPCQIEVREEEHQLKASESSIRFPSLMPNFAIRYSGGGEARCANDIELRIWSEDSLPAEIIPEGGITLVRAAGALDIREWRSGKRGLVHLPRYKDSSEYLEITSAASVFSAWLKQKGWEVELSNNGHIAKQMLKHLRGMFGVDFLAKKSAIDLFEKLATGVKSRNTPEKESDEHLNDLGEQDFGRTMLADTFRTELRKIAGEDKYKFDTVDKLAQQYIKRHMVQLGFKLQCPECRQRSWFSITDADYDLRCPQCLSNFRLPEHDPREISWAYRAIGPFSLPRRAYGVYSVLLTLRLFTRLLDGATTPMLSFTAKKGVLSLEADLALFFQRSKWSQSPTELVFAECKTFGGFEKKDKIRMLALANEFPGAVLVFATLQKALTKSEIKLIRVVANRGRKYFKSERPFNPVLILTGNELFADDDPRDVWKELGGDYAKHHHTHGDRHDLVSLADATQQIYLGMKPWHEKFWAKSRKKMAATSSALPKKPQEESPEQDKTGVAVSFPVAMRQVPWR